MQKHRELRRSIRDQIEALFETPPAESGMAAFNVYHDSDYRTVDFIPTAPYIYLLDSFQPPVATRFDRQYPQVVIEIDRYAGQPFEIGNRHGRVINCLISIFGRNRGERDDLGAFIADYFGTKLAVRTYPTASSAGTIIEEALLDDEIVVQDEFTPRLELVTNGSLVGWTTVAFVARPKL